MHFAYEGFTQQGDCRRFQFRSVEERAPGSLFSIEIDLELLLKNRMLVQDGPMFCLQLLTSASVAGPTGLNAFHSYRVVGEDFRPLLMERERKAAEKALKKPARRPFRKPPFTSNLRLGMGAGK